MDWDYSNGKTDQSMKDSTHLERSRGSDSTNIVMANNIKETG